MTREELFASGLKKCTCCGNILPLSDFGKRSNSADGFLGYCKKCTKEKRDRYYESEDNKQKARNRSQQYREKHRQEINEKRRRQYQENDDIRKKSADWCRKYRENNKEKLSQYKKNYRLSRLDFFLDYNRQYYQTNREYFSEWRKSEAGKLSSIRSHEKRRCLLQSAEGEFTTEDVARLLLFFDNKCAYTGEPLEKSYHLDHVLAINNGGTNYIWNIVPSNPFPNLSKGTQDMESWYRKQSYFSEDRLQKIYDWIESQKNEKGEIYYGTRNIKEAAV